MKPATRGFTLLEVLLASALSTVMLLGLWSLLSLHIRLFTKAPVGVEESQLVRSLALQLSDDLGSALPARADPTPVAAQRQSASTATSVPAMRTARLIGTRDSLQVDVLRASVPEETGNWPHGLSDATEAPPPGARATELRTVSYSFAGPTAQGRSATATQSGLIRQEWSWDTPAPEMEPEQALDDARKRWSSRSELRTGGAEGLATPDAQLPNVPSEAMNLAPEVMSLEFRYFDGNAWSSWWDSLERRTLPVAVEVLFYLRPSTESKRRPPPRDVTDSDVPRREPEGHRVRLVVHLPASARHSASPATITPQHPPQQATQDLTGTGPS